MGSTPRSYLAEFLGTFMLVFVGTSVATLQGFSNGGEAQPAGWLGVAFAFGFTLIVLAWAFGGVSGGHFNPAVSIPMAISGRLPWKLLPGYIIAQCLGATAASFTLWQLLTGLKIGKTAYDLATQGLGANGAPEGVTVGPITLFGYELIMTAFFLYVIFTVTRKNHPAGFAPLAIGMYLFVAHLIGVPLGELSLNPARSLGPALVQGGAALEFNVLGIFLVAPVIGGIIGWAMYDLLHDKEQ